ncbi:hypothetical protein SAMN06265182_0981 [Persephonella hydrogeniphila]|uniref:Uncharacterized protein n=1 Tax=Persephonella hydrogeniphila TaxID=198703 RepID=A0A285NE35_9AQUI|nr:hypothetical protein SAMN06265182_0981 [Persephonella hydrogeniphila]
MRNFIYAGFLSSFAISNNNFPVFTIEDRLNSKIKKSIFEFHKNLKTSIPITYTPKNPKKLGQVGHLSINLTRSTVSDVIYNTISPAGTCCGIPSSPSINWSALCGQTLFQKACLNGEFFGKGKGSEGDSLGPQKTGAQKK